MYKGLRIAAVVPAHNESNNILEVIDTLPETVDIIAITNDCSTDNTSDLVKSSKDLRVYLTDHETNTGVGGAIITAHEVAISKGSDINVVFAGDGQMDPAYLPQLLDPIVDGLYGYSKGNRLFSKTSHKGMPKYRIFGNYVLSYINKAVSGYWKISDPQNGYTAVRTDVLNDINYKTVSKGYEFENDMLSRLNEHYIPVVDVDIPARYRNEVSGISLRKVIPALIRNFFLSYWGRLYRKYVIKVKPIPLFLLALFIVSILMFFYKGLTGDLFVAVASLAGSFFIFVSISAYDFFNEPKPWNPVRNLFK